MANLAASLSIMAALRLTWSDVAVRLGFGVLLNLVVYLTNDTYDIRGDLAAPDRDRDKAQFLLEHRGAALGAQGLLVLFMVGIGWWHSPGLIVTLVAGAGICWVYSARIKRVPFLDVATIAICGVAGSMVAFPLDSVLGWCLAGQLGLFAASFQVIQMMRDHDSDARFGTHTTVVHLGFRRSVLLHRALMLLSAVYAIALVNRWLGLALLLAPMLPVDAAKANRDWNRIRLVFGVVWLAMVGWILWTGTSNGLVVSAGTGTTLSWMTAIR